MIQSGSPPFPLGVFVGNPNYYSSSEEASFETNFNAFSTLMRAKPQFLDQYADQRLPIPQWVGQASWNAASVASSPVLKNVTPVIGLPMTSTAPGSGTADQFYKDFAAGKYDSVLKGVVKAWADHGFTTQIWRPGWEMNVSSMPSYAGNDAATRADWVKAFQHIYTVLHAAGEADGVKVQVMWNPDVVNYSNAGNVIQTAYPGNPYVDIIGADIYADVYPYGSPTHLYDWDKSGQVLNSPHPVYDTSVQQWAADPVNLQHYYTNPASNQWSLDGSAGHATTLQQLIDLAKSAGKPLAIAETGAGNTHDGARLVDNPIFVQWLAQTLHQSGVTVSFVSIWNSNSGGIYHFTNAADGKPLEAAAWAKYFGAASTAAPSAPPAGQDGTANVKQTMPRPAAPTVDSGGNGITNDNTLELKGSAAAGSTVKIYDGSNQIGSTTADSTGSWDYITKVLTDAKHTLTATATNSSGQISAASSALAVTIDTKAPAAPSIVSDVVNSAHQVVVTGAVEANSTVKLYYGTTQVGTATANSSGAWSMTTPALPAGSHLLTAKAIDVAGNISAASSAVNSVIGGFSGSPGSGTSDSHAPAAPKISSFSKDTGVVGDHITSDHTVTLSGSAAAKSTVKVYDGTTQIGTVTAHANGTWAYTTAAVSDGKHTFAATDTVSGATSAKSAALALTVDTAAPDAPVLLSDSIHHHRATVTGTAEAVSTLKVYEGTSLLGTTTTGADGHFSVTTSALKSGSHTFVVSAADVAGNTSALSQPIDPPIGSHSGNGTSPVEVTKVHQHWDHTAMIKGTADANIKLYDGTTSAGSVTAGADGEWSFQTSDLSGKTHVFTAEQVDTSGHVVGTSSGEAIIGSRHGATLAGTTGNDIMVGKGGADTFVFASNFGHDVIKDFAVGGPAHDMVQFSKSVVDSFASVLSHAAQSGHDIIVVGTGSDTLTLKHTKADALNNYDFHFG